MSTQPYKRARATGPRADAHGAASKGQVRRAQLVTTFGPGSVLPLDDEAFMVCGIDRWLVSEPNLHEPRLARELNVRGFVVPPAAGEGRDVPVVRFPRMHSCPGCRRLAPHDDFTDRRGNTCQDCNRELIPSRFIVACPKGHIQDFPYLRWAHEGSASSGTEHELSLETRGRTASLGDIVIRCSCGASRPMTDAFDRFAVRAVTSCFGNRPWLKRDDEECDQHVRALQRGASNVWFSHTRSALSIPPWSGGARRLIDREWHVLKEIPDSALADTIRGLGIAERHEYTPEDLAEVVLEEKRRITDESGQEPLRRQEYEALCRGKHDPDPSSHFVAVEGEIGGPLRRLLAQVMLVKRLREIRALDGFSRVLPIEGPKDDRLAPLFDDDPGWLPAIEVKGEGVFIRLDPELLAGWAGRAAVRERVARLDAAQRKVAERGGWPAVELSAKKVALHTLAHVLIDQFSLEAGYPTASLRERLYVEDEQAGILVYTATTDSAGSLGGLIAQARTDRLENAFVDALERASWCSADPVCMESDGQGVDGLNLAACHACALLPETSCEMFNTLLDRALLVGTPESPELGLLSDLVTA